MISCILLTRDVVSFHYMVCYDENTLYYYSESIVSLTLSVNVADNCVFFDELFKLIRSQTKEVVRHSFHIISLKKYVTALVDKSR